MGADAGTKRLFIIFNADFTTQWVTLPSIDTLRWHRAIDTSLPAGEVVAATGSEVLLDPQDRYIANPRSTVVLLGQ